MSIRIMKSSAPTRCQKASLCGDFGKQRRFRWLPVITEREAVHCVVELDLIGEPDSED